MKYKKERRNTFTKKTDEVNVYIARQSVKEVPINLLMNLIKDLKAQNIKVNFPKNR